MKTYSKEEQKVFNQIREMALYFGYDLSSATNKELENAAENIRRKFKSFGMTTEEAGKRIRACINKLK